MAELMSESEMVEEEPWYLCRDLVTAGEGETGIPDGIGGVGLSVSKGVVAVVVMELGDDMSKDSVVARVDSDAEEDRNDG